MADVIDKMSDGVFPTDKNGKVSLAPSNQEENKS